MVDVKELNFSYHLGETILITTNTHCGDLIQRQPCSLVSTPRLGICLSLTCPPKQSLEAQLPMYWVPVLGSLYKCILSITQGLTIWVPGF